MLLYSTDSNAICSCYSRKSHTLLKAEAVKVVQYVHVSFTVYRLKLMREVFDFFRSFYFSEQKNMNYFGEPSEREWLVHLKDFKTTNHSQKWNTTTQTRKEKKPTNFGLHIQHRAHVSLVSSEAFLLFHRVNLSSLWAAFHSLWTQHNGSIQWLWFRVCYFTWSQS